MTVDPLKFQAALNQIEEARQNLMSRIEDLVDVMTAKDVSTNYNRHEFLLIYANTAAVTILSDASERVTKEKLIDQMLDEVLPSEGDSKVD